MDKSGETYVYFKEFLETKRDMTSLTEDEIERLYEFWLDGYYKRKV